MTSRVYVPATVAMLAAWHTAGEIPADAERFRPERADEESEYAALMTAADASAERQPGGGRRVVLVADPPADEGPIPFRHVVAVHCDPEDRAVDADPDEDLAWFATQEIPDLI
jgi:hypothetical protein